MRIHKLTLEFKWALTIPPEIRASLDLPEKEGGLFYWGSKKVEKLWVGGFEAPNSHLLHWAVACSFVKTDQPLRFPGTKVGHIADKTGVREIETNLTFLILVPVSLPAQCCIFGLVQACGRQVTGVAGWLTWVKGCQGKTGETRLGLWHTGAPGRSTWIHQASNSKYPP